MNEHYQYSEPVSDDTYDYRYVIVPPAKAKLLPRGRLLTEAECKNLGVQQSPGWVHFMIHRPEPHILIFRRPKKGT